MPAKIPEMIKIIRIFLLSIFLVVSVVGTLSAYTVPRWNVGSANAKWLNPGLVIDGYEHKRFYKYRYYEDEFGEYVPAFFVDNVLADETGGAKNQLVSARREIYNSILNANGYSFENHGRSQWAADIAIWGKLFVGEAKNKDLQKLVNDVRENKGQYNIGGPALAENYVDLASQNSVIPVAVPEPAAVFMLGIGLLGIVAISRRKLFKNN